MIKEIKDWLIRHRWWAMMMQVLIIIIVFVGVREWQLRDAVSGAAPDISGELSDQQSFSLRQYKGQPALVYFWASWCPMCKMTNANIESIARDYQVITIASWSGDAMEVEQFLQDENLNMPVIADNEGIWAQRYGVKGVPASFVIDGQGEIQFIESGYTTEYGLRLRLWWLANKD